MGLVVQPSIDPQKKQESPKERLLKQRQRGEAGEWVGKRCQLPGDLVSKSGKTGKLTTDLESFEAVRGKRGTQLECKEWGKGAKEVKVELSFKEPPKRKALGRQLPVP